MMGTGQIAILGNAGAPALRHAHLRVEKACNASDLNDRTMHSDDPNAQRHTAATSRELSQSETQRAAPLWHGPRLSPAFVAQVLGQVMESTPRDARSVFAAYEDGAGRAVRPAFERKI